MAQTDDILQRAILDVNKIKQVSLQVAKEKLHQQFSNDLKKKYLAQLSENFSDNEDATLLEAADDIFGDEGLPTEEETPGEIPGQAKPGEPTPGVGGQEAGLGGPPEIGGAANSGLPPQAGQTTSPVVQSDIPVAGVDDNGDGSVIVLTIDDGDSAFDLSANEDDLKAQTSELLASQEGLPAEEPNGLGQEDPAASLLPPGEQGRRSDEDSIFAGIFDEEDPYEMGEGLRTEGVLKISDDILLEYIQKSLDNDDKFSSLSSTIEQLQKTVDNLSEQLNKSNSDMASLKEQNIRLMFKNKALNDDSLSEPQKQSIVKALDKAKTLNEAKTVYETVSTSVSKPNNKAKDVNALLSDNVTRKFLQENRQPSNEEAVPLTSITKKLFDKWGI